jgi:S-formylglutathione hydrolase FrmB
MILSQINLCSDVLSTRCTVNVLMPQRKPTDPQDNYRAPFRVLYLLHGYSDDQNGWQRETSIERYAEGLNLAVVMPAAQNSYYTDMAHGGKFFTFLAEELPTVLHELFPLSSTRADTFVAGLSMGGYGAFKLALSHPNRYAAAASLSGAVDISEIVKRNIYPDDPTWDNPAWLEQMQNIFGDLEKLPGSLHDLFNLAMKVSQSGSKPRLFQYCGTEDILYRDNQRFRDFIRPLGFDYTYQETPGDHSWIYWDRAIQRVLNWLAL